MPAKRSDKAPEKTGQAGGPGHQHWESLCRWDGKITAYDLDVRISPEKRASSRRFDQGIRKKGAQPGTCSIYRQPGRTLRSFRRRARNDIGIPAIGADLGWE